MEKTYNPNAIEQTWYQTWEKNNYFAPSGEGEPYCIMLPPPNVTGSLHMGHGFCFSMIDILIRYHRMQGRRTLWQGGCDHAGIATQMVVERQLMLEGQSRHDLGREAFVNKIWEWKNESGGNITRQLRRLGASIDWSRERFTMDEKLCEAVTEAFVRLHREGLIYRGTRLVNWDPKLLTAISDLEVIHSEEEGKLWHIRYPLTHSDEYLTVATTRPETLLGDVAVAVHPDDTRYQHWIGQQVQLPLTGRTIPIIADDYVDATFGSGCVKITPAHDFNDYAIGQRHRLKPLNIFTPDAHLNASAPNAYQGLERFAAREQIIHDLNVLGLIEKIEKHTIKVPRGDRSGVIIEPYLTQQWFMKMESLAKPAIDAIEKNQIKLIPDVWNKTYFQWLHHIEDWCISRQLWWGHRIPAWYDEEGQVYVGHDEIEARQHYRIPADTVLQQDSDVLDTWFSSALWPFSTLGWPEKTRELTTFYPTQVLVTGFDIIFFWVARMVMLGLHLTDQIPFKEVFITGLIRDAEGHKMSKSKGNVLDPLDLIDGIELDALVRKRIHGLMQPVMAQKIEKNTREQFPKGIAAHGTDALRFTFCALASYGREIRFDLGRLEGYRNFCNKLWNAARYVFMNTEEKNIDFCDTNKILSAPDHWILSRLQNTISIAHDALANYRFDLLAHALYEFTWNEFCDWYLELSKPILNSGNSTVEELNGTRHTLIYVLENILRLLHPVMPFITEEIWQRTAPLASITGDTIMLQPYPLFNAELKNDEIESELTWVKNFIIAIRTIRSEMNIAPGKLLSVLLNKGTSIDKKRYEKHSHLLIALAKLENCTWVKTDAPIPESAIALVDELEILIPMEGLINKKEEAARLTKEIIKLKKEIERAENKLQNPSFIDKAPPDIVKKEQEKLAELKTIVDKLEMQHERFLEG
ncbi:MAG: valS [Gammaproteobacteria bacterium]|jgi:valyl-tRNA synthetase|nr:valS [Gammaproteobacteria bacterium]